MSTLKADTIVASDGTSPVTLTKQSAAKTWHAWNATGTAATLDSFNVSSLTDNDVADFTHSFTNSFSTANYSLVGTACDNVIVNNEAYVYQVQPRQDSLMTASNVETITAYNGGHGDYEYNSFHIHGDLA